MTREEKRTVASVILFWVVLTSLAFIDVVGPALAVLGQWWAANR
jgi:hypothetical protein